MVWKGEFRFKYITILFFFGLDFRSVMSGSTYCSFKTLTNLTIDAGGTTLGIDFSGTSSNK